MKEFKLELINPPGGVYFPGMVVTGNVSGYTDVPKNYKAIQVRIIGGANVHWSESRGTGDDRRTEHYSSAETYIDTFIRVWDRDTMAGGGQFPAGHFRYPFTLQLVGQNLPASYKGAYGSVRYKIEARVMKDGLLNRDESCETDIPLVNVTPTNIPELLRPVALETSKTVCCLCCASGPIVISASIPRSVYCIQRDTIPVEVTVENGSNRRLPVLMAELIQCSDYYAQGHRNYNRHYVSAFRGEGIGPHNSTVWRPVVTIPDTNTTASNCGIIKINYVLRVSAALHYGINPVLDFPITLGNVPLDGQQQPPPGPPGGLEFGHAPPTTMPLSYPPGPPQGDIPLNPYPSQPPPYTASQPPIGFVDPIQKM